MELYVVKHINGALMPYSDDDKNKLKPFKIGESFKVKITRPRNLGHHKKYFAFLNIVFDNLPENLEDKIKSIEDLRTEIKMQLGFRELKVSLSGVEYWKPKSISFAKMDQSEFEKFYSNSIDIVCKYILPGVTSEEIKEQIVLF